MRKRLNLSIAHLPVDASPTNECLDDGVGLRCDMKAMGPSRNPLIVFVAFFSRSCRSTLLLKKQCVRVTTIYSGVSSRWSSLRSKRERKVWRLGASCDVCQ